MNRLVMRTGKDSDGDIIRLCGSWGSVSSTVAIGQINRRECVYYVENPRAVVRVGRRNGRPYLTTAPDGVGRNNLDNLPDC